MTYDNNVCVSSGLKFTCVEDPDFESWPGQGAYNKDYDCSPYFGPSFIWAYPPTCMNITNKSTKYECTSTKLNTFNYDSYSPNCSSNVPSSTTSKNLDQCIEGSTSYYYSCPMTILPGVAFLAIGNAEVGNKIIDKTFVGGIFSILLVGIFLLLLILVLLFYHRRVYRPLKKLIMELANNSEDSTRESQKEALENLGAGSFCVWLCTCCRIDTVGIKKIAE